MEVSSIANLATSMSQAKVGQELDVAVLKKALDLQSASALSLIQAIPPVPNLPVNLGQNINVAV